MPHINRIRLVNVHFNNATQFYDDFMMEMGGRHTTYDLENGGGKSLLLLMILQTVLPKSYLRKEKPVSLLFQGGKDRTSHVAVEWILEEGSSYKYLLTGFSARKRKGGAETPNREGMEEEENLHAGDIEHLNWCVFYHDHKITGTKTIPLIYEENGKKIVAGFEEIRKWIQQMRQKGLPAEVFDGIDRYQSYIAAHQLLTAEWNIIKGINSGETNIESYFRQNPTSRKLIENQFVKIIEDIEALNKGEKSNDESLLLADTLIEIRSRLNEYLKLKEHMAEFGKIKDYYMDFGRRNEGLYQHFKVYEDFKQEAAAIRNLIATRLTTLEKEKNEALTRLESNKQRARENTDRKKLLEAGLVNHEKESLLAEKRSLEVEKDRLDHNRYELEQNLNRLLTYEAYGEYRSIKEKLNEIHTHLQALEADEDTMQVNYRQAGGRLKFLTDQLVHKLEALHTQLLQARGELDKDKKSNEQALIGEERKGAVLEADLEKYRSQENKLGEKLQVLHDFFLGRGEMEAVLTPREFFSHAEEEISDITSEIESITSAKTQMEERVRSLEVEIATIGGDIKTNLETQKLMERWMKVYQQKLSELKQKAVGFGKTNLMEYKEGLELLLHKEGLRKLEKEIEAGRMRQKKQLSQERGYYVPNEEILTLVERLSDKCEFVKAGIEWLDDLQPADRERVLREMPFLAYSVIIDRVSFDKLKNGKIKPDFCSDYPVPVVSLEKVRLGDQENREDVYYFCSFAERILDRNRYEEYIRNMETALQTLHREISAIGTRVTELNDDLVKVTGFYATYPQDQVQSHQEQLEEVEKEITVLKGRQRNLQKEKEGIEAQRAAFTGRFEELTKLKEICKAKMEKLTLIMESETELGNLRDLLRGKQSEWDEVTRKIGVIRGTLDKQEKQYHKMDAEISDIKVKLHDAGNAQKQVSGFEAIENHLPMTQAYAEYNALHEAVSGRTAQETELRKRLGDYEERQKAIKERILRDYEGDLEQVEQSEAQGGRVTIPSQSVIKKAKLDRAENANILRNTEEEINKINLRINNAEGRLEEILKGFPSGQASDLPRYDSEIRYQQEIELVGQLIKSYHEEIENEIATLESIKQENDRLHNQAGDYEAFMDREKVNNDGVVAGEMKDFRQFEKEFRQYRQKMEHECARWDERMKTIHAETVAFVIREPLEELGRINAPVSAGQCQVRKEAFTEYIANIEEQIAKINNDILKLESYQQDFTRRCIQRAELVLGHLKKLESLSRIEVYGRRINMIELKLPEFEEKEKHLRMKAHIDGIVREISVEGVIDRKRVAVRLSTKELLAQITDMDKASVRLYKVESIPENSRFYRWEHAIGSEGQNNSLYFIFAACLISYIRMLSITHTSLRTKKVIIADNPFGATSAVYLWEPMFKIMKQNDIQLVAPGHRIPREITSRFGVSYLLNQDILQDGRMRVVIKDVRVEEDEDLLGYIDLGQLALFE